MLRGAGNSLTWKTSSICNFHFIFPFIFFHLIIVVLMCFYLRSVYLCFHCSMFCLMPCSCYVFFILSTNVGTRFSKTVNTLDHKICKTCIFYKTPPYVSFFLFTISVINKGSEGRYLVTFLEVPKIFKQVLGYVWNT